MVLADAQEVVDAPANAGVGHVEEVRADPVAHSVAEPPAEDAGARGAVAPRDVARDVRLPKGVKSETFGFEPKSKRPIFSRDVPWESG